MKSLGFTAYGLQLKGKMRGGLILFLCCFGLMVNYSYSQIVPSTQPEKTDTRKGNKQFDKENYTDAEANYKKALDKKNNMPEATFNLGDAVYEQKRYDEAAKQFQLSAQTNADNSVKAKAFHNLGNTYLEQKKWEDAIKSYKDALKLNPNDKDTKYNLAYANAMMVQQKNQQQNKNQDKKDKKDQDKKDQQNKPNPDSKQDQQQGKNDQQNKQDQQKKQGSAQAKLSKADAEKLLQALMNEEQKTNQKVQQKEMKPVNVKIQKDW
jgi:Ca-activated chloride channel family protein